MKNIDLTHLEEQVLESLISDLYAEPGFSDVDAHDISRNTKIDIKSVRGAVGSLVKKGIIYSDKNDSGYVLLCLTEQYYYLHPRWEEQHQNNNR
jgi:DNA-binding MarR family transcriptional regulator